MEWISKLNAPQLLEGISNAARPNYIEVNNPANGRTIAWLQADSAQTIQTKIERAAQAQLSWANLTAKKRSQLLKSWFDLIELHSDDLATIMTLEQGKPLHESKAEVAYGASFVEWFAEEAKRTYGSTIPATFDGKAIRTIKQPVGVCAAITPWNFPIAMLTRKIAPALAAGCAMISKPAINTPLCAVALLNLAKLAGIDPQLMPMVYSDQPQMVGDMFTSSSTIRKLSFTGSTAVGQQLMAKSAVQVQRVSMELGGNAPFIVFADANIEQAVAAAIACKLRNAGQTCVCANRFYIHTDIYDEFAQRMQQAMSALTVGDGLQGSDIGPLIDQKALAKVSDLVEQAIEHGAKLECGGSVATEAGELFYSPTLLTNVAHDNPIMLVEQFGPVAALCRFETTEQVIEWANDTNAGLASYFFTHNITLAERMSRALEYGIVGCNEGIISTEVAPFGGMKHSGVGREGSALGIDEYLEVKYIALGNL